MSAEEFDLIIAGGGLVGGALALALAPLGKRIALVEARAPEVPIEDVYNERSVALGLSSRLILEGIGLWSRLADAAEPMTQVHVSQRGRFGATRLHAADEGLPALGYVIVNRLLLQAMLDAIADAPNIVTIAPARVVAVQPLPDAVAVSLSGDTAPKALNAALLIAADGAHSPTRQALGIAAEQIDYEQSAVVANVHAESSPRGSAFERFTDEGPMALLPLGPQRYALVWTQTPTQAEALLALDERAFLAALQARFGYRAGTFTQAGRREAYPLSRVRAARLVGERALLIGNAAHTVHPVAGQGLNLALRDVATLASLLRDAPDPGDPTVLHRYAGQRQPDIDRTVAMTDGLLRVFANPWLPVSLARTAGLFMLDFLPAFKRRIARIGMGLAYPTEARLARGTAWERRLE
ncbi:MAG: 2-octaprenyl-6-methoxyphenyl hydroxylase [Thiotrichales bacterium]